MNDRAWMIKENHFSEPKVYCDIWFSSGVWQYSPYHLEDRMSGNHMRLSSSKRIPSINLLHELLQAFGSNSGPACVALTKAFLSSVLKGNSPIT